MRGYILKKRHDNRGMTLVELMLVIGILSIVMLAVMSLYIPAQQSTIAQSQVSDIQGNLRLALKTMTRDLLHAGFLVPSNPVVFPGAAPDYHTLELTSTGTESNSEFVIRTRIVGNDFARIYNTTVLSSTVEFRVTDSEMVENFTAGTSKVRLFEPITGREVIESTGTESDRVYDVVSTDPDPDNNPSTEDGKIVISRGALTNGDVLAETLILRVRDENQPALQAIRYLLEDGTLFRFVNDDKQILARNVDTDLASSRFDYYTTPEGRINLVDIKLTGKTKAIRNDAVSGEKQRALETTVKLRNIF